MSKNILITGSSGGFGKLTVLKLLAEGHHVIASMRDPKGKNKDVAQELEAAGARIVEIDVTDEDSVAAGVKAAGPLDALVNNAGTGAMGLQESFTAADWQRLFNINVFGVQRMNRAVLPAMRAQRSGLIVHVSSLLGRTALPFYGPYNASKWALEALAENYRVELSGFGVDVCLVEPGGYPTSFMDALLQPSDPERDASYGDLAQAPQKMFENFQVVLSNNPAQDPQNVANTVAALIDTPAGERSFRTVVDKMGWGDLVAGINENHAQATAGLYRAFGLGDMLTLRT